jgi:hypothetical protein
MTKVRKNRIIYNSCSQLSHIIYGLSRAHALIIIPYVSAYTAYTLLNYYYIDRQMLS